MCYTGKTSNFHLIIKIFLKENFKLQFLDDSNRIKTTQCGGQRNLEKWL